MVLYNYATHDAQRMNMTLTQSNLISASEMSRIIKAPVGRILKGIRRGAITPDSTVLDGRLFLFREDRASEVKQALSL